MIRIGIKVNPESNQTLGVHFYMFAFIIASMLVTIVQRPCVI